MANGDDLINSAMGLLETTRAQIGAGRIYRMDAEESLKQTLEAIKKSEAAIVETDQAMRRWWYCANPSRN